MIYNQTYGYYLRKHGLNQFLLKALPFTLGTYTNTFKTKAIQVKVLKNLATNIKENYIG